MEFKAFKEYTADEICVLYTLAKVENRYNFTKRMVNEGKIRFKPVTKTYEIVDAELANYLNGIDAGIKREKASLARKLMDIFPTGSKTYISSDTGQKGHVSWRGSEALIRRKIDAMFKFNGGPVEEELLLQAAKQYVDSFKSDNTYMQVLPYFLIKKKDGELDSEMLKAVENVRSGITITDHKPTGDWTSSMV